jgi:hypothetical protein
MTWLRASADGNWSRGTRFGVMAAHVARATPLNPAMIAAPT